MIHVLLLWFSGLNKRKFNVLFSIFTNYLYFDTSKNYKTSNYSKVL